MKKFVIAALGVAFVAGTASAQQIVAGEPLKAKTIKGEFVAAYAECTTTAIDDSSNAPLALPACGPAALSAPGCTFGSKGSGKFAAAVSKTDIKVSGAFAGLNCPDNTVLTTRADARTTTSDCQTNVDCTLLDLDGFPTGSTTVLAGKAKIKTTTETAIGLGTQVFKEGESVQIDLGDIEVLAGTLRAFGSGLKVGPK